MTTESNEPLGIPIEMVGRGRQLRRAPTVVFRVPHQRVAEAILALELQGFVDVLAYQTSDSPTTAEWAHLLERAASRAKSGAAVTSGTFRGALIGFELRRVVQMLRRRRLER